MGDPSRLEGMSRYGISADRALGVSLPQLRAMAKEAGKDHFLAGELWASGVHEAMILASMVEEPEKVTREQMERWVEGFYSWDLCDQCCNNLFRRTPYAWTASRQWCGREEEFVRRAGFVLLACLAVHDRKTDDEAFVNMLEMIERYSSDRRNFVMKAVNWALRQIGKRNIELNMEAVKMAKIIALKGDPASRWVAADALRELESAEVRQRLMNRER